MFPSPVTSFVRRLRRAAERLRAFALLEAHTPQGSRFDHAEHASLRATGARGAARALGGSDRPLDADPSEGLASKRVRDVAGGASHPGSATLAVEDRNSYQLMEPAIVSPPSTHPSHVLASASASRREPLAAGALEEYLRHGDLMPRDRGSAIPHPHRRPLGHALRRRRAGATMPRPQICLTPLDARAPSHRCRERRAC